MGVPIAVDDSMLDDKIKFLHPNGTEQVFDTRANEVIEVEPTNKGKD